MTTPDWRKLAFDDYSAQRQIKLEEISKARAEAEKLLTIAAKREAELAELDRAAVIFNIVSAPDTASSSHDGDQEVTGGMPSDQRAAAVDGGFKDVALAALENIYPRSMKASELQTVVERKLLKKFHYKTAGMTLFRFSKDGVVTRDGRQWRFVPPAERNQLNTASESRTVS